MKIRGEAGTNSSGLWRAAQVVASPAVNGRQKEWGQSVHVQELPEQARPIRDVDTLSLVLIGRADFP